jgi:hypothetical protein
MSDRQIHPFNKSGVQPPRKAQFLQGGCESCICPQTHHVYDARHLAPPVAFFYLAVDQTWLHLPPAHVAPSTTDREPVAEVGCQCIKVEIEPVACEKRKAARGQALPQRVDEPMGHKLCAGTQMEDRKDLRAGIDGQPEPEHVFGAAESGAQFVQLEVREVELAEKAFVQSVRVYTCASEPGGDSGLTIAEDPFGGGRIQPFGQSREHHGDLLRGGFQTIQGRVAPGSEVVRQA